MSISAPADLSELCIHTITTQPWSLDKAIARDAGLEAVTLCRGSFFAAIAENRRAVEEASALGAPLLLLVCGADPAQSLETSCAQIRDGIEAILSDAARCGVRHVVTGEPFGWTLLESARGVQPAQAATTSWRQRRWVDLAPLS